MSNINDDPKNLDDSGEKMGYKEDVITRIKIRTSARHIKNMRFKNIIKKNKTKRIRKIANNTKNLNDPWIKTKKK